RAITPNSIIDVPPTAARKLRMLTPTSRDAVARPMRCGVAVSILLREGSVLEARARVDEGQIHGSCRAVALFADDELRLAAILVAGVVDFGAIEEQHEIAVLLDRSRFAQIGQHRALVAAARLDRARELGE